jgi:hypothetical protein
MSLPSHHPKVSLGTMAAALAALSMALLSHFLI